MSITGIYIVEILILASVCSFAFGSKDNIEFQTNRHISSNAHLSSKHHGNSRLDKRTVVEMKKSLGILRSLLAPLLVPVFVPMILFVGIVLLIFFALIGVSMATSAPFRERSFPFGSNLLYSTAKLAQDVLGSEECVERISCEIFRIAQGYEAEDWIVRALKNVSIKSNWMNRISRLVDVGATTNCKFYTCSSISSAQRTFA